MSTWNPHTADPAAVAKWDGAPDMNDYSAWIDYALVDVVSDDITDYGAGQGNDDTAAIMLMLRDFGAGGYAPVPDE